MRYTDERKDLNNTGGESRLGTTILTDPATFYDFAERAGYDAWTPKGSIQVETSHQTFVYISATRGFKSGGFNPAAREPGHGFSPEFAWSYEGGLKRTMAGGRVRTNAALFYSDYQDLQVQSFIRPGVPEITNAGAASIKGVEAEVDASMGRGLKLAVTGSWLDATYDRYLTRVGGVTRDAAGNRLNNAPAWSGSGSAVYEFAASRFGTVSVRADVGWQTRVFFTPLNNDVETQPAYTLAHLRAGFEPRRRRWEIALYARNVGNRQYITGTANVPLNAFTAHPGDPRQWWIQFTIRH